MLFENQHELSLAPKCFFMAAIVLASIFGVYLMFQDADGMIRWLKPYALNGDLARQVILMFCLLFYVSRLFVTVFVFLKRKMSWPETLLISALMSFVLFSFARVGGGSEQPIGAVEIFGLLLYLFGSYLNTFSEYQRYVWKAKPENKGRLYTEGLFKYSMHVNYFGDVVLFIGFALITNHFTMLIVPLAMTANFVLFVIPALDKYLANKYGREFQEYAEQTKKLIPMAY